MSAWRGLSIALVVFILDQAAKYTVTTGLGLNQIGDVRSITTFFQLSFVSNCGVSLGLLQGDSAPMRWALVALTGGIAAGVLVWLLRERNRVDQAALGAVFGGALGNIADRVLPPGVLGKVAAGPVRYPNCVIDYADLHFGEWRPFLVFNLADAAITIGVLVLLARALLTRDKAPRGSAEPSVENVNA